MQAIDKLKADMDDWARQVGPNPRNRDFEAMRMAFSRSVPKVPEETLSALFTTFLSRYGTSDGGTPAKAVEWLVGVGSLLLADYDGTPFTKAEWEEIRELVTIDSGEIDIETLSYVLGLALEHGAL
jgi:hypothetical protein